MNCQMCDKSASTYKFNCKPICQDCFLALFEEKGWKLRDNRSGVIRVQEYTYQDAKQMATQLNSWLGQPNTFVLVR